MKAVLQRVTSAGVAIDGGPRQGIGPGLVVLFGVEEGDREEYVDAFVQKIVHLRIFSDEAGKLNLSLLDQGYSVLAVPNFTLCANCKKGRRPSFERSARPNFASACFDALAAGLRAAGAAGRKPSPCAVSSGPADDFAPALLFVQSVPPVSYTHLFPDFIFRHVVKPQK